VTIFSAPNYENAGNKGAVLVLEDGKFNIKQFTEVKNKPYHLPRMVSTDPELDVMQWAMPFLLDKIMNMITHVAVKNDKYGKKGDIVDNKELAKILEESADMYAQKQREIKGEGVAIKRGDILRAKVRAFSRMNHMTNVLRRNSELVSKIKSLNPSGHLDLGTILGGPDSLMNSYILYRNAAHHIHSNDGRNPKKK
jgi:hypothetical protein